MSLWHWPQASREGKMRELVGAFAFAAHIDAERVTIRKGKPPNWATLIVSVRGELPAAEWEAGLDMVRLHVFAYVAVVQDRS